jgi:thiol-disulfide isomerase/thioredoxin
MSRLVLRGLALVVALLGAGAALAAAPLPVDLTDPRTGQSVRLTAGPKALHVVFFATWCPPCIDELDRLDELEARWAGRGYRLIVVSVPTRQTASRLAAFATEHDPPGEMLFDTNGTMTQSWGAGELPTHVIVDANGAEVLRAKGLGPSVEEALDRLLGRRGQRP